MVSQVAPSSRVSSSLTSSCVPRLWVQWIACVEPATHATFVLGAVTVISDGCSVKATLLMSASLGSADQLTRIRPWVVGIDGSRPVHVLVVTLSLATADATGTHVAPASGLNAMSTVSSGPRLWVHVTVLVEPAPHVTAVFGAVTMMRGVMVKSTSLASVAASPAARTRMRARLVGGAVTVHANEPAVADALVTEVSGAHVLPPSRLMSMAKACPIPRLCVNRIVCTVPERHVTAVFGAVTVTTGAAIENATSLMSDAAPSTDATRTSAAAVGGPVTVHTNDPDVAVLFCTDATTGSHVVPSLRDRSIRTNALAPRLSLQRIVWAMPTVQFTAVFGAVTVRTGAALAIVKLASDASDTFGRPVVTAVTRTRAFVEAGAAGVHAQVPCETDGVGVSPVHPGMGTNVAPPLRDSSTVNVDGCPENDHLTVDNTLTNTFSPPFGDSTVTVAAAASTSIVTVALVLPPNELVAATATVNVPEAVGVPEMTPVVRSTARPAG